MPDHYKTTRTEWPKSRARRGAGLAITYGWHETSAGRVMIAATARGICFLGLRTTDMGQKRAEERLRAYFPAAKITRNNGSLANFAKAIDARWRGHAFRTPLPLDLYGTAFQLKVWDALLDIPFGKLVSYADIARKIGAPRAPRAVGGAVGDNPVSLLVPCHRVIQSSGKWDNYGWGSDVKGDLIRLENAA